VTDTTHHLRTTCPFCGEHHDRISAIREEVFPEDGDATMCFRCGAFCIIDSDSDLGMRKPTKKEQRELDADDRIRDLRRAWETVKRQ
jgi:hypothetical protein